MARRCITVARCAAAFVVLAAASAVAVVSAATSSPWKHDTIEHLEDHHYSEEKKLYRVVVSNTTAGTTYNYVFDHESPPVGAALAARLRRKPNASNWEYISIEGILSAELTDDAEAYYAAGFAEGYTTMDEVWSTWVNQVEPSYKSMQGLAGAPEFIDEHLFYFENFPTDTPFGAQLRRMRYLLNGLTSGWQKKFQERKHDPKDIRYQLNMTHMYLTSYMEELLNVNAKFARERRRHQTHEFHAEMLAKEASATLSPLQHQRQHCSAMVRRTSDDVLMSHDTWGMYNTMLRQFKTYKFGDSFVAMSGYPGSISSIDDFYMTSNKLAVTETTNGFFNETMYDLILPTQVATFNRAMIANFVARTPKEWFDLFAYNNSGTYNNQWMVLDTVAAKKACDDKTPLPDGCFFVGEQVPGMVIFEDQTRALDARGFWPSFNIPFYPQVYAWSGFAAQNTPDSAGFWSYTNYSRALIFDAKGKEVVDDASMWYMLRYNDWETDPASRIPWCKQNGGVFDCSSEKGDPPRSAALSIAARFDLAPRDAASIGPDKLAYQVNRGLFGAIDTKMTSAKMLLDHQYETIVVNGPTAVQQTFFDLDTFMSENPNYSLDPWRGVAVKFDAGPARLHPLEDE